MLPGRLFHKAQVWGTNECKTSSIPLFTGLHPVSPYNDMYTKSENRESRIQNRKSRIQNLESWHSWTRTGSYANAQCRVCRHVTTWKLLILRQIFLPWNLPGCLPVPLVSFPFSSCVLCTSWCTWSSSLSVSYIALLPLWLRRELLVKLPIADVCLLEDGPFVRGMDMEEVWKNLTTKIVVGYMYHSSAKLESRLPILSAKARCYGQVARAILHHHCYGSFRSYRGLLRYLYAIRNSGDLVAERNWQKDYEFSFPPRYVQYQYTSNQYPSTAERVETVVHCFRGLPEVVLISPRSPGYHDEGDAVVIGHKWTNLY